MASWRPWIRSLPASPAKTSASRVDGTHRLRFGGDSVAYNVIKIHRTLRVSRVAARIARDAMRTVFGMIPGMDTGW